MLALAGGNVIVVLSVPASVSELLTVSVFPSVPASVNELLTVSVFVSTPANVKVLLTVKVFEVVPPATEKPVERAASVRLFTVVGEMADAHAAVPPLTVRIWPVVPMERFAAVLEPLPTTMLPSAEVVTPVPP